MDVGLMIKKRRQELGMTQEELAKKLGYNTTAAVCRVERGKDKVSYVRVKKFAEALDTTVDYLIATDEMIQADDDYAYKGLIDIREKNIDSSEHIFKYAMKLSKLPENIRKSIETLIDNASK